MNESIEQLKAIINDAPEGATHYSYETQCFYEKSSSNNGFNYTLRGDSSWRFDPDDRDLYEDSRALSDIKTILELKLELQQVNLDIYYSYHVSQIDNLPESIKKAWLAGQDSWVKTQTELD